MHTFTSLPDKYRWLTYDEVSEYNANTGKRWGWQKYVGVVFGSTAGYVRPYDCMIEFGMDHDHDPEVCEHMMFMMNEFDSTPDYYNVSDEFGQLSWED